METRIQGIFRGAACSISASDSRPATAGRSGTLNSGASAISRRSYSKKTVANSWEEIWEAGPYYERISELLEDAENHVIFVGWQIDSRLPMSRPIRPPSALLEATPYPRERLREKVIRLCESKPDFHVYFLIWDHSYLYVIERELWQGRIWDEVHPRVHFIFDNRHAFGSSHHEKICIIDGVIAFCGGIDLCDERGDTPNHFYNDPRRSLDWKAEHHGPYHDMAVQVTGEACIDIHRHVERRWKAISSIPFPGAATNLRPSQGHQVYISRTVANDPPGSPIVREIEFLFRDLIKAAKKRVILEGQYYWSTEMNDLFITKLQEMRGTGFELIIILSELRQVKSFTRVMAQHQMKLLEQLRIAAQLTGTRLLTGVPYVAGNHPSVDPGERPGTKPIYVHSKVLVIDDRYLSIGSANFARRALRVDTELTLTLEARTLADRSHIRGFAARVLKHWKLSETLPTNTDVFIRPSKPTIDLFFGNWRHWFIPLDLFFDPIVSWFQPFRWRFRRLSRQPFVAPNAFWLFLVAEATAFPISYLIAGSSLPFSSVLFYSSLTAALLIFPVPFFAVVVLASLQLGVDEAARIILPSFWTASLFGYAITRIFPLQAHSFYNQSGGGLADERLGVRTFQGLLRWIADPRVNLQSKIAYEGLYCVPFPWFVFATWIVLPACIYVICKLIVVLVPPALMTAVGDNASVAIAALLVLKAWQIRQIWTKRNFGRSSGRYAKKTSQGTDIQYP